MKSSQQWLPQAIHDRLVPDHIVDANLIIHYLKYAATRQLLTKRGTPKQTNERLSAVRILYCISLCACSYVMLFTLSSLPSRRS